VSISQTTSSKSTIPTAQGFVVPRKNFKPYFQLDFWDGLQLCCLL